MADNLEASRTAYAEAVHALVRQIPIGRVMTYGLIAEILQEQLGIGGPRVVGNVLAGAGDRYQSVIPRQAALAAQSAEPQEFIGNTAITSDNHSRSCAARCACPQDDNGVRHSDMVPGAVIGPAQDNFDLPWWRVVNVAGSPPPHYLTAALAALEREGTPMKRGGLKVDVEKAVWFPGMESTDAGCIDSALCGSTSLAAE